ncbi:hypothetical protein M011DRAFT_469880 [Sporormia fimetaria CBS 119925]|uniref:tRNA(Ile)-lysidine synthetase n=1 Tax=Sporormia fimetaria CBS 119925 TaxID=1340428 RepID=A0A6A6V3V6_9PLEO|nr:hypothetical protein M011DRAFT_469880 [Sporormia fimetaria CBS 119925]
MESTIVPVTWPADLDLNDLNRFETEARRLRYQALGTVCRDMRLKCLLVAHHADDQAETIMMRLVHGRFRSGLQGMQPADWIPECQGIYGVHHSGGPQDFVSRNRPKPFPIETGGIRMLRPLLGFDKKRLIATCEELDTPWVEDHTNQDPTLTARNAVRHVMHTYKLPKALSNDSLLSLAEHMRGRLRAHATRAENLLVQRTRRTEMDLTTGSLIVDFPSASSFLPRSRISPEIQRTESAISFARNTAYLYLQRIVELISPREVSSIGQLSNAIDVIWPALSLDPPSGTRDINAHATITNVKSEADKKSSNAQPKGFCVFGVWFRPLWSPSDLVPSTLQDDAPSATNIEKSARYLLCRQPLDRNEAQNPNSCINIHPSSPPQWHLFDNRFWLWIKPSHESVMQETPLKIRMLSSKDISSLHKSMADRVEMSKAERYTDGQEENSLQSAPSKYPIDDVSCLNFMLSNTKPADLRYGVPAIFRVEESGEETLLALPTLERGFGFRTAQDVFERRVRYRKIDVGEPNKEFLRFVQGRDLRSFYEEARMGLAGVGTAKKRKFRPRVLEVE